MSGIRTKVDGVIVQTGKNTTNYNLYIVLL